MSENDENSLVDKPHVRLMKECQKTSYDSENGLGLRDHKMKNFAKLILLFASISMLYGKYDPVLPIK